MKWNKQKHMIGHKLTHYSNGLVFAIHKCFKTTYVCSITDTKGEFYIVGIRYSLKAAKKWAFTSTLGRDIKWEKHGDVLIGVSNVIEYCILPSETSDTFLFFRLKKGEMNPPCRADIESIEKAKKIIGIDYLKALLELGEYETDTK